MSFAKKKNVYHEREKRKKRHLAVAGINVTECMYMFVYGTADTFAKKKKTNGEKKANSKP